MSNAVDSASPDGRLPPCFEQVEKVRIEERRKALGIRDINRRPIGLAFSGGGIRSATLSLGFMQGLARRNLLAEFDYLSTVSGGGYAGAFYGSLHLPGDGRTGKQQPPGAYENAAIAAAQLKSDIDPTGFASWKEPTQFLRDNGNYLAPNGGGDLMLASAIAVRNWIGVQYLIGISLITLLFGMSALRSVVPGLQWLEQLFAPRPDSILWWSPWWIVPAAVLAFVLIPIGAAYWLTENDRTSEKKGGYLLRALPVTALAIVAVAAAYRALQPPLLRGVPSHQSALGDDPVGTACWVAVAIAVVAATIYFGCKSICRRNGSNVSYRQRVDQLRNMLTNAFVDGLRIGGDVVPVGPVPLFVATVVAAAVDTLGQSLLLRLLSIDRPRFFSWAAVGTTLIAVLRFAAKHLDDAGGGFAKKIPLGVLASVAAAALTLLTLTLWSIAAHAMLICFPPYSTRTPLEPNGPSIATVCKILGVPSDPLDTVVHGPALAAIILTFVVLLILAIICGWSIGFLNLSTLQRLYSTRLTRAYLGASNPNRLADAGKRDVSELVPGDNIELRDYYASAVLAPVHLINVTLNTTVAWGGDGKKTGVASRPMTVSADSRLVHRNNRGMSMCVGPAGISVGAQYAHLRCDWENSDLVGTPVVFYTGAAGVAAPLPAGVPPLYVIESLSLGDWCATSGAAVSTGLGARTRTGLSLVLGVANVRLGYWWNSAVTVWTWEKYRREVQQVPPPELEPSLLPSIMPRGRILSIVYRSLSTQICLLSELIGRFYGPRRRRWYLTDGGHFENTAAYELVRRRLELIVMLDNGADGNYAFDDLANLIRRARLDFQVEITEEPLGTGVALVLPLSAAAFTTMDAIRKEKKWGDGFALCFKMTEQGKQFGHLIVVKPRVQPYAPLDIRQYANGCEFPQQSTLQQFFDEAEWESYRKLGEVMALHL